MNDDHESKCACGFGRSDAEPYRIGRPSKLYFETTDSGLHYWILKSSNGKVIGSSHFNYKTKASVMRNCVGVMGLNLLNDSRIAIDDPVMRNKIYEECRRMELLTA